MSARGALHQDVSYKACRVHYVRTLQRCRSRTRSADSDSSAHRSGGLWRRWIIRMCCQEAIAGGVPSRPLTPAPPISQGPTGASGAIRPGAAFRGSLARLLFNFHVPLCSQSDSRGGSPALCALRKGNAFTVRLRSTALHRSSSTVRVASSSRPVTWSPDQRRRLRRRLVPRTQRRGQLEARTTKFASRITTRSFLLSFSPRI